MDEIIKSRICLGIWESGLYILSQCVPTCNHGTQKIYVEYDNFVILMIIYFNVYYKNITTTNAAISWILLLMMTLSGLLLL